MNVDDFNGGIVLEMLTKLGDVNVHASGIEIVVVDPNCLQREVAFENFIDMCTKKAEEFAFLSGELGHLVVDHEHLLLSIESELSNAIHGDL